MNNHHESKEVIEINDNLGSSLMVSVSKAGASDIAVDVAEMAFDSVVDEGLLEDVPVFGWLKKGYNIVGIVRDRIFLKKIANFLAGTKNISDQDRKVFLEKINNDPAQSRKVGESLVLLLERQEDFEKSFILGKLFSRYVRGIIEYDMFLIVSIALEISFIGEIRNISDSYKSIEEYDPLQGRPFTDWLNDAECLEE